LAAFTGVAVGELAATTPKAPRRQSNRLTYRKNLTDAELDALVGQIGGDRLLAALDRITKPRRCDDTADFFVASVAAE
jgi:hypothetical protein